MLHYVMLHYITSGLGYDFLELHSRCLYGFTTCVLFRHEDFFFELVKGIKLNTAAWI
jgi:hypothetical protein